MKNHDLFANNQEIEDLLDRSPKEIKRTIRYFINKIKFELPVQKKAQLRLFKNYLLQQYLDPISFETISIAFACSKSLVSKIFRETQDDEINQNPKFGAPHKLNDDENSLLLQWIMKRVENNDPPRRNDVSKKAQKIIIKQGRVDILSKNWVDNFVSENSEVIKKTIARPLEELRQSVEVSTIRNWFDLLLNLGINDIKPGLIINIDETGFGSSITKNYSSKTVIIPNNIIHDVFYRVPRENNHVSVIMSIVADGGIIDPGIISTCKNLPPDANRATFFNNISYYYSKNGFISKNIFQDYLKNNVFPYIINERNRLGNTNERALIIVDGHLSHLESVISAIMTELNIWYLFIPPHSSHILQPLDRFMFSMIKQHYKAKRRISKFSYLTSKIENIYISLQESQVTSYVITSFSKSGIIPYLTDGCVNSIQIDQQNVIKKFYGDDSDTDSESSSSSEDDINDLQKNRIPSKNVSWGIMNDQQFQNKNQGLCPLCGHPINQS